ncbi:TraR/DksA family transcriptional regulator [Aurantiacibacter rhizosphaerae]|uniref:TraR/DksA family transcriptional regulator n=1 Tax=Aurantiacibacter rhizosphaerae TaxID=2691582 RepID=A0A844X9M3_9SPHN|nr:TraR/DksA C4-type zinc finger protein [Aurantiacibacter rhizosphaerae]MWV26530.1 TraR/DksA family transcriptional regulator [Aurantiacibacter rhizosphaerae]
MTEDDARTVLRERLAELARLDALSEEGRAPVTLQQDSVGRLSRMDAMQQQTMAQAEERRRNAERTRIIAALARLDEREWGYCGTCGEEIAEGRLRNDPSVVQCLQCASARG